MKVFELILVKRCFALRFLERFLSANEFEGDDIRGLRVTVADAEHVDAFANEAHVLRGVVNVSVIPRPQLLCGRGAFRIPDELKSGHDEGRRESDARRMNNCTRRRVEVRKVENMEGLI